MRSILLFSFLFVLSIVWAQPGAYQKKNISDPLITNKTEMALLFLQEETQQIYRLSRICEAWAQVVAGMNYRLILELETDKNIEMWEVVLFEDLKQNVRLSEKKLLSTKELPKFRKMFPSGPGMVGAYKERSLEETDIQTMRDHLIALLKTDFPQWEWIQAHQSATQIVAGINVFFLIEVKINGKNVVMETVLFRNLKKEITLTQMTLFENDPIQKDIASPTEHESLQAIEKMFQQENPAYKIQNTLELKRQSLPSQTNYWIRNTLQKEAETQIWEILLSQDTNGPINLLWKRQIP